MTTEGYERGNMRRILLVMVALALVAVAVVGCGGGNTWHSGMTPSEVVEELYRLYDEDQDYKACDLCAVEVEKTEYSEEGGEITKGVVDSIQCHEEE